MDMKWREILAINQIELGLQKACAKHQHWPDDPHVAMSVITEEVGELAQAILQMQYEGGPREAIEKEAVHVGAMAARFLTNLPRHLAWIEEHRQKDDVAENTSAGEQRKNG